MGIMKTIDDISRTLTTLTGAERFVGRDDSGDFKIQTSNFWGSISSPTYYSTGNYVITDSDGYTTILAAPISGDVTITLPLKANNSNRFIRIMNVYDSSYKVIISPNGSDASTLSGDGLTAIWLPKKGDFVDFLNSNDTGKWEIVNERITAQLRLNTYAGYGSTDTKIMRFTNSVENVGNMFSENHSTGYSSNTKGLEITINRSGRYSGSLTWALAGAIDAGFTLNSASLATSIDNILFPIAAGGCSNNSGYAGFAIFLKKNDVIRVQTDGVAPIAARTYLNITYLGQ